jgi:hypothetical protein
MLGPTNMNADTWRTTPRQPPPKKDVNGNGATPTPPRLHGAFEHASLGSRFRGLVLLELAAATSHLFDGSAHVGDLSDDLRELPR